MSSWNVLVLCLALASVRACEDGCDGDDGELESDPFVCFAQGHCLNSEYLDTINVAPEAASTHDQFWLCKNYCQGTPQCNYYTVEADGMCVLLSECGVYQYGGGGGDVTSRLPPSCPEEPVCYEPDLRCLGTFLAATPAPSAADCHRQCLEYDPADCDDDGGSKVTDRDVRCGAFTWEEETGACTLTVGCDRSTSMEEEPMRCQGCVAGHAICNVMDL